MTREDIERMFAYQAADAAYKYIVSDVELIDALFAMIIKLKEEGVI